MYWQSITKTLKPGNIVEKKDFEMILPRTEIRSRKGNSHLVHVFNDGLSKKKGGTGKRFCMNSAALKFIPKEKLEEEGYEKYLKDFE